MILVLALSLTVTHCWTGLDEEEEDGADESLLDDDDEGDDDGDDDDDDELEHEGNGNGFIDPSQFVG